MAAILNIVIGLVTSVLSGGSVWLWDRGKNIRVVRRKAAFFGLKPGGTCLIVMNNKYNKVGSTHHHDVHAMIEVATLANDTGTRIAVESCNDFHGSNGDRTEFCIGGPTAGSNPRTGGHLASHVPGVTICPYDPARSDSLAFEVGGRQFLWDRGNEEYALVAKFTPPGSSRPVIVISGQTSITNRAAIHFLKSQYRTLSKVIESIDQFCIVVRVTSIGTYGYQAAELASDVSAAAFADHRHPSTTPGNSSQV